MASRYVENLIKTVVDLSESDNWDSAVYEWEVYDCEEDDTLSESCICGKEHLYYLYTIRNTINGNLLEPIGSSCIKKFRREELNSEVSVMEKMFKLYHAVEKGEYISLSTEFFSRKLLKRLYDEGVFQETKYNNHDGYNDYKFLLDMFNKRDKDSITTAQHRKIRAIIVNSIRPYLIDKLSEKTNITY